MSNFLSSVIAAYDRSTAAAYRSGYSAPLWLVLPLYALVIVSVAVVLIVGPRRTLQFARSGLGVLLSRVRLGYRGVHRASDTGGAR